MIEEGDHSPLIWFLAHGDVLKVPAARQISMWDAVIAIEREANKG